MYRVFIENNALYAEIIYKSNEEIAMRGSEQLRMWATFLSLSPILLAYMFVQKSFMASVASTGIKG